MLVRTRIITLKNLQRWLQRGDTKYAYAVPEYMLYMLQMKLKHSNSTPVYHVMREKFSIHLQLVITGLVIKKHIFYRENWSWFSRFALGPEMGLSRSNSCVKTSRKRIFRTLRSYNFALFSHDRSGFASLHCRPRVEDIRRQPGYWKFPYVDHLRAGRFFGGDLFWCGVNSKENALKN